MFLLDLAAKADRGLVRATNQDVANAAPSLRFVSVAGGMGPAQLSDMASRMAARSLRAVFSSLGGPSGSPREIKGRLVAGFRCANETIGRHPSAGGEVGLRAALIAATFTADQAILAAVGDVQCYRLREGRLESLRASMQPATRPSAHDSPGGEPTQPLARASRYLDGRTMLEVDTLICECRCGDVFVLCSDGLWSTVQEPLIIEAIERSETAIDICERLVRASCTAGGLDNVAVAVAALRAAPVAQP